ncbi:MAG: glycosyltransferase [Candidatus Aenigmarchaeota archaeon]|nr:glycosyltransferase [Candidatus Aenigmarchaeota archaeon]
MALKKLSDYQKIIGNPAIESIRNSAAPLEGKSITHVNATSIGGGVAEILNSLTILMNDIGIHAEWDVIKGGQSFFNITKGFHNALQGQNVALPERKKKIFLEETERNSILTRFHHDLVVIHDPQPAALINYSKKKQPWLWRCHIDITSPHPVTWSFLEPFLKKYDGAIYSLDAYKKNLGIPEFIIPPSIDPLSLKNMPLTESRVRKNLTKNNIDPDIPIITQVSRFDKWKDPLGVIRIFEQVQKKTDCQLVLAGNMASDDPEGPNIYKKLMKKINANSSITTMLDQGDIFINALQRASSVVLQNSIREGFALTVSEALWKSTPVVARPAGGIPLQVLQGKTGFLASSEEQAAKRCINLLKNEKLRTQLGQQGREHVKKNFLITRHLQDYINLFRSHLT